MLYAPMLLLGFSWALGDPSSFLGAVQQDMVFSTSGQPNDRYGIDVAVDGGTALIGSQETTFTKEGAVYVYTQGSGRWEIEQRIQPADVAPQDFFGSRVAICGDTLVAGAWQDDNSGGVDAGAAYVFVRQGTTWSEEAKLLVSDNQPGLYVGRSVDIDGDRVVLGATDAFGRGQAYVFDRQGTTWTETARLEPSFGGGSVLVFGNRSKVRGSTVVASDPLSSRVVVFDETGATWTETQVLAGGGLMGTGLELDESADTIFAGAPEDADVVAGGGAVLVYDRGPTEWTLRQKLIPGDVSWYLQFGYSLAVSGDTLLVGTGVNNNNPGAQGKVYVFRELGGQWCEMGTFEADDGLPSTRYGEAADLDAGMVVVGATAATGTTIGTGAAYFHVLAFTPETYCTAKVTSQSCVPAVDFAGSPTWDGPDDFLVLTRDAMPQKPGLFFWSTNGRAALPFLGGTLCVAPPLARTAVQLSGGTPPCDGGYAFFFSQACMAASGLDPGDRVNGQFWMRDPAHPDGTGVALSDALEFGIQLALPGVDATR